MSDIPVFRATPSEDRRTLVNTKEQKVAHPSLIPVELLRDEFLGSLIHESLPRNYNFEVHKTIWKIKQTGSKRILLQLPEGLIRFGPVLVDIFRAYFSQNGVNDIQFITMGDLTYGACCIDDYLASSMGCDLIVHYAHSCLVPINQLKTCVKYLYIFLDIKFDLEHVIECVKHNFDTAKHKIAIASTIQFTVSVHELAKHLRQLQFDIVLPQSRPLSSGEVLGCTAPKLDPTINTILFICDGRFHLEALMIANPTVEAFRYDPYSRKMTHEAYAFDEMYDQRWSAIKKTAEIMKSGGTLGFVLGTLGRQGNERVFDTLIDRLQNNTKSDYVKVLMPEVLQEHLTAFENVDAWIQVACPRLSIDWGSAFQKPLLNPYEFAMSIKYLKGQSRDSVGPTAEKSYPMDFYAKHSCGDHTPNHSCLNNQSCNCSC